MTDSPFGNPPPDPLARGQAAARSMSDRDLGELHGQGPSAFEPGAWNLLDQEIRRRGRVKDRNPTPTTVAPERYPALRTTVGLLKMVAVVVFLAAVITGLVALASNGFIGILIIVGGLLAAVSYWAAAELLIVLMDIEANTRSWHGHEG